jgi:hypothetical protein
VVIHNNGTPEDTWAQVRQAWSKVKGAAEAEAVYAEVQHVQVQPVPAAASAGPAQMMITSLDIVRGMPRNADQIALLIHKQTGQQLQAHDVIVRLGQKSYMMAVANGQPVGLVGFLVENLVTRVDEFMIVKQIPVNPVATALIQAFERASRDLQSEVGYVFLPPAESKEVVQAFVDQGYQHEALEQIKIPAWREAVRESRPDGTEIYSKKLRAERVLKPL